MRDVAAHRSGNLRGGRKEPDCVGCDYWPTVVANNVWSIFDFAVVTSDQPVGIRVLGYGDAISYQYPGGLNLQMIAPPIVIY